ncbi:MAG: hypothetical protein Q8O89_03440 [Nanoarchaeota archaeon]|nr:hypothetical protein [Nanoarchaeota archaeon]
METIILKKDEKVKLSDAEKDELTQHIKKHFGTLKPKNNKTDRQIREESSRHFLKKYGFDSD